MAHDQTRSLLEQGEHVASAPARSRGPAGSRKQGRGYEGGREPCSSPRAREANRRPVTTGTSQDRQSVADTCVALLSR